VTVLIDHGWVGVEAARDGQVIGVYVPVTAWIQAGEGIGQQAGAMSRARVT
jgi:hypothetical protein